jgi:lysophospholipid acyltransferase (LPLAT)-like uncharacterized protein
MMMRSFRRNIATSPVFNEAVGIVAASYLRLVWRTSQVTLQPPRIYEQATYPAIIAMWHGQHLMAPFIKRDDPRHRTKVLVSRHRDGEINARAAERLNIETIRGSGAHDGGFHHKGGAVAFTEMLEALKDGYNIAMTADVPKIARVAGLGVVKLAQHSRRPIYAVAIASSRRIQLDNWDRTAINLPFSRIAVVASEAIFVRADADREALEAARKRVEDELNRLTIRAYEIADKTGSSEL